MRKRYLVIIISLSILTGIFLSKPVEVIGQIFRSEKDKTCVTSKICVGANIDVIHNLYEADEIGGLNAIFCGKIGEDKIEYLFLRNILQGETCEIEDYALDFRTDVNRTVVYVSSGKITKITQGPLHTLDL